MAADAKDSNLTLPSPNQIRFPNEIIANILLHASTPTFLQLTRTSRQFQSVARSSRQVLLHHLKQLPGDKATLDDGPFENENLFLLVRQRAANHLYGVNFTANLHEHLVKNAKLEPSACSISGLDADYVRMALVFKDSIDIRQYTNHGKIKEKIETCLGTRATILKLVQWARWVSVLCRVSMNEDLDAVDNDDDLSSSSSDSDDSDSDHFEPSILKPTANSQLSKFSSSLQIVVVSLDRKKSRRNRSIEYRIVHFDVYTIEDSQTFIVDPYLNYVPRDFAVHSTTNCAILWDRDTPKGRPTEHAAVVTYTTSKPQLWFPVQYEEKVVWPKTGKPERPNTDSDDDDTPEYLPERISFFKEGRRIKLYDSGGVVPYEILSSTTTQHDQYASTNVLSFDGFSFHVDTPFFGTHATYWDDMSQHSFCFVAHLCLGMSTLDIGDDENENEVRVLCILRSQTRLYPENCDHRVSLQRMTHVSAGSSTVVARLWGFEELQTSLTGKEIVAISQGGTRIAIAMWNKVYIYPINPKVLCEDVVVDSSDDEIKAKKKKKKSKKPWTSSTSSYYQRRKDQHLLGWKVAEIRPIVLDLNGAIAHKMSWSPAKGPITDTYVPEPIVIKDDAIEDDVIEVLETTPLELEDVVVQDSSEGTTVELATDNNDAENTTSDTATIDAQTTHEVKGDVTAGIGGLESTSLDKSAIHNTEPVLAPDPDTQKSTGAETSCEPDSLNSEAQTAQDGQPATENTESVILSAPIPNDTIEPMPSSPKIPPPIVSPTSTEMIPLVNGTSSPSTDMLPTLNQIPSLQTPSSVTAPPIHKPSLKRKDKSSEITNSEIIVMQTMEKEKEKNIPAQILAETKSNSDISAPPSPTLSKTIPKPKQTVSEALSISPTTPQQLPPAEITTPTLSEAILPIPDTKQQSEDIVLPESSSQAQSSTAVTQPILEDTVEAKVTIEVPDTTTDATDSDLSKTATSNVVDPPAVNDQTNKEDEADKVVKRKKRITEDELIILTDRGIQVWNVGARAKGKRKKSILPLEESLKGKLPNRHGKAKATIKEHMSDVD